MLKNVGSQVVGVQMITAADGTDFTSAITCEVTKDGGIKSGGGGTGPTHEGEGFWTYIPTQAETNADHIAFTFAASGAISTTVQVYTDASYDRIGAPAGASASADIAAVKAETALIVADTGELQSDDVPGLIAALDAVVDTVKAETALIVADTNELQSDDVPGLIAALDAVVDTVKAETALIVADTNELQGDWADTGRLDTILDELTVNIDAIETDLDEIKGPTFSSATDHLEAIRNEVFDLGDSQMVAADIFDATMTGYNTADSFGLVVNELQDGGRLDLLIDAIKAVTDAMPNAGALTDLATSAKQDTMETTLNAAATAAALTTAQNDLDIITGASGVNLLTATQASIDAIELDTGTTLPALIDDLAVKKNATFSNFEFLMVLTSDHVTPATGLTVTGQRSIDGAAFASVGGSIAEVSNGIYQFDALAADTNGDVITWRFSSATADDTFVTFKTVA